MEHVEGEEAYNMDESQPFMSLMGPCDDDIGHVLFQGLLSVSIFLERI